MNEMRNGLASLRRPAVLARTGLSCSTIYDLMAKGQFPRRVKIGVRAVGWLESEVADWIASRIAASRQAA